MGRGMFCLTWGMVTQGFLFFGQFGGDCVKINRKTALVIWRATYGNALYAKDFTGRYMYIDDFGNRKICRNVKGKRVHTGWNLHHVLPKANNGTDAKTNLICTNIITNDEAGDKTTFVINNVTYQVHRNFGESGHSIVKLS